MKQCSRCRRTFPEDVVSELVVCTAGVETKALVCPLCALHLTNEVHGTQRNNFPAGSAAQYMLERAKRHLACISR
jgi:hypothetical protein